MVRPWERRSVQQPISPMKVFLLSFFFHSLFSNKSRLVRLEPESNGNRTELTETEFPRFTFLRRTDRFLFFRNRISVGTEEQFGSNLMPRPRPSISDSFSKNKKSFMSDNLIPKLVGLVPFKQSGVMEIGKDGKRWQPLLITHTSS